MGSKGEPLANSTLPLLHLQQQESAGNGGNHQLMTASLVPFTGNERLLDVLTSQ
jgi:hypothetical protein